MFIRAAVCVLLIFSLVPAGRAEVPALGVGLLTELSGSEAPNGRACRLGYDVAARIFSRDEKLARRVRLLYGDHRAEPMVALSEFKRLSEVEGISAVIANRGPIGMALDPVTKRAQVPFIGVVGHIGFIRDNPYGIRIWVPMEQDGRTLAEVVRSRGLERVAVVALFDDYIMAMVSAFRSNFELLGGKVTYFDTIDKSLADFGSIVTAVKRTNPDVVFANGSISQLGMLVRKLREQGMEQQIISNFWISYGDVVQSAGLDNIEGALFVGIDTRRPVFLKEARDIDGSVQITSLSYACYSALSLVYATLKNHPGITDKKTLHQALSDAREIPLPDENVPLIGRESYFKLVPYVIRDGRAVVEDRQE